MNYWEYSVKGVSEEEGEVVVALVEDLGFESFMWEGGVQKCYINSQEYPVYSAQIDTVLSAGGYKWSKEEIVAQNWNAVWESEFEPIVIEQMVCVRAPQTPKSNCQHEILLTPNMSFGTGHHPTTFMMLSAIGKLNLQGKQVLDVGCGSAVLGIYAKMLGAETVVGVDIDQWSVQSAGGNVELNGVEMTVLEGTVSAAQGKFDLIVANINRNVLIGDMKTYAEKLQNGGEMLLSGFLEQDITPIRECAEKHGFRYQSTANRDEWQLLHFLYLKEN